MFCIDEYWISIYKTYCIRQENRHYGSENLMKITSWKHFVSISPAIVWASFGSFQFLSLYHLTKKPFSILLIDLIYSVKDGWKVTISEYISLHILTSFTWKKKKKSHLCLRMCNVLKLLPSIKFKKKSIWCHSWHKSWITTCLRGSWRRKFIQLEICYYKKRQFFLFQCPMLRLLTV